MWRSLSEEILRGKQTLGTYQAPGRSVARAFAAQRTKRATFSARPNCFASGVVRVHVVIENLDELGDDFVAFEGGEEASIDVDGGFRFFERAGQRDAEAGVLRFSGAVDDAAHDRYFHLF